MNCTNTLLRGVLFMFIIGFYPLAAQTSATQFSESANDSYHLEFHNTDAKKVTISARLTLEDSLLSMSQYGPVPHRWPQYIRELKAFAKKGTPITISKRDSTAWKVDPKWIGQSINLEYHVVLNHEEKNWPGGIDGVAFVRDWGIMASGRSLFVVNGKGDNPVEVTVKVPAKWTFTSPWEPAKKTNTYQLPNQLQLLESLLFAGTHEEVEMIRDDFRVRFVLGGDGITKNAQQYSEAANKILDYYIEEMGGVPNPAPGQELSNVLVLINQSDAIEGEVIGNHISLFLNPSAPPQEQIISWFLFAHEFFHLWNGKSLRFQNTQTDWFKEGFSNYYTIKALYHAQLVSDEDVKMVMNNLFYNRYVNDPGYGELAPSKAASGFDKDNHWGLIYGGGLFAGICLDMQIRQSTHNTSSLDDVMRYFYTTTAGTDTLIGNEDILRVVNDFGKTDFTDFLNRYIHGTEPVPLKNYLKYAGIDVQITNGQLELREVENKPPFQEALWQGFLGIKK